MLDTHARRYVQPVFEKAADICVHFRISANAVTLASFFVGICTGLFVFFDKPFVAVVLLWLSGILDGLDGTIARKTGQVSGLGTLMDVTFDRMVEISVIWGVVFRDPSIAVHAVILTSAIILSMTIFLTVGAIAQNRGTKSFHYQAGVAERTEGFIMLSLMILLPGLTGWITIVFAAMIFFTAYQRFSEAGKLL